MFAFDEMPGDGAGSTRTCLPDNPTKVAGLGCILLLRGGQTAGIVGTSLAPWPCGFSGVRGRATRLPCPTVALTPWQSLRQPRPSPGGRTHSISRAVTPMCGSLCRRSEEALRVRLGGRGECILARESIERSRSGTGPFFDPAHSYALRGTANPWQSGSPGPPNGREKKRKRPPARRHALSPCPLQGSRRSGESQSRRAGRARRFLLLFPFLEPG